MINNTDFWATFCHHWPHEIVGPIRPQLANINYDFTLKYHLKQLRIVSLLFVCYGECR